MGRRYKMRHPKNGKWYYVERDRYGRFKNWVPIGRSIARDRKRKAKHKVKPGYGHRGDVV